MVPIDENTDKFSINNKFKFVLGHSIVDGEELVGFRIVGEDDNVLTVMENTLDFQNNKCLTFDQENDESDSFWLLKPVNNRSDEPKFYIETIT